MNIEVLETATVFEDEETVYRYDLTTSNIASGGDAAKAVVEQSREILGDRWTTECVRIDAPSDALAVLTAAFAGAGVLVREDVEKPIPPAPKTPKKLNIPSPNEMERSTWFIPAVIAIACCVAGACWWGMQSERPSGAALQSSGVLPTSPQPSIQAIAETPPPHSLPGTELSHGAIRVRLPEGFKLEQRDDGALTATGPDAELRVLLAVDPVYGVNSDAVYHEVEIMIANDDTLSPHSGEQFREHAVRTIDYKEEPGDGSQVSWVTWVEADHQFSVGCHTRTEATIPQLAVCRMAAGTIHLHLDRGSQERGGTNEANPGV